MFMNSQFKVDNKYTKNDRRRIIIEDEYMIDDILQPKNIIHKYKINI